MAEKVTLIHPIRKDLVTTRDHAEMILEKQKTWNIKPSQYWKIKEDANSNGNTGTDKKPKRKKGDKQGD